MTGYARLHYNMCHTSSFGEKLCPYLMICYVPNTLAKMKKDEDVSLRMLGKICKVLDCDFKDMVEYIKDEEVSEP